MGKFYDSVPVSAIVRIRDMMYTVKDPFRLDQGDVSFDAPETFKQAVAKAMTENRTHYLPTAGIPPLRKAFAEKMRNKNHIPVESDDEILVTNGGTHGLYAVFHALLEPGDEVIVPDPEWPPTMAMIQAAGGKAVQVPLREDLRFRWNIDDVEKAITPKTRVLYLNSPNNPSGGVLTREDIERLAAIAKQHNLWVVSDEAYEDVVYHGEHISIASLPGMYDRTIPVYTLSKSYAITGVRVGYFAIKDKALRDRALKIVLYTTSNVSSIAQYGAVGALEGSQQCIADFKTELLFRRDMFYKGLQEAAPGDVFGHAARRRVLCVREDQSGGGEERRHHRGFAVVGDGGVPDQARAHRLCARRGLRRQQRRLHPLLHLSIARRAYRRAGVDEGSALARRDPLIHPFAPWSGPSRA